MYSDPNFYLVTLQEKVKEMQSEERQLEEEIKKYEETLRVVRTDVRAE